MSRKLIVQTKYQTNTINANIKINICLLISHVKIQLRSKNVLLRIYGILKIDIPL